MIDLNFPFRAGFDPDNITPMNWFDLAHERSVFAANGDEVLLAWEQQNPHKVLMIHYLESKLKEQTEMEAEARRSAPPKWEHPPADAPLYFQKALDRLQAEVANRQSRGATIPGFVFFEIQQLEEALVRAEAMRGKETTHAEEDTHGYALALDDISQGHPVNFDWIWKWLALSAFAVLAGVVLFNHH